MTSALGLAATSAVLQQLVSEGFVALKLDDVLGASPAVTCLPPERAQAQATLHAAARLVDELVPALVQALQTRLDAL